MNQQPQQVIQNMKRLGFEPSFQQKLERNATI